MQALVWITRDPGQSDTVLAATLGRPAMLAHDSAMASYSSTDADELHPAPTPAFYETAWAQRATLGSPVTSTISRQNPTLFKPDLTVAAQAPKLQAGSRKPSPLLRSDAFSSDLQQRNNPNSSPSSLSPPGRSPRERLEALLASETTISSNPNTPSYQPHDAQPTTAQTHAGLCNASASTLPSSPPASPENMLPSRPEPRPVMARNHSKDSQTSSVSSKTAESGRSATQKQSQDSSAAPASVDVAGLVASAGSAEAALAKLLKEKQGADSHNAQLWRLVEKQRAMILGLNKDLEKALKDRDRYRRKLKEVTQNASGAASVHRTDSALDRQEKSSEASATSPVEPSQGIKRADTLDAIAQSPTDGLVASIRRQATDTMSLPESTGDITSIEPSPVSSTSKAAANSRDGPMAQAVESPLASQLEFEQNMAKFPIPATGGLMSSPTSPTSPPFTSASSAPKVAIIEATPLTDGGNFSPRSSKMTRKAAPAPLNLAQPTRPAPAAPTAEAPAESNVDAEPTPDPEELERGRRRTREEDDRVREAYVMAQEEARSLSKKSKSGKSKSKSKGPSDQPQIVEPDAASMPGSSNSGLPSSPRPTHAQTPAASSLLSPSGSESSVNSMAVHRSNFSTPLLSPGLPMSPRPGDRPPLHAPSPRLPKQMAFPMPGQQPPPSPHVQIGHDSDRYTTLISPSALPAPLFAKSAQAQSPPSPKVELAKDIKVDSPRSPQSRSNSDSPESPFPDNVFRGLVSEQYPNLLLPPNAVPLIDVKVFSSRLRPSRHSLLLANPFDEDPVFLLGIYARSNGKQLWRLEKTIHSLPVLHQAVRSVCDFDGKLPDKSLFMGHAPAKIDARRAALNAYFDLLLDTQLNEKAALAVCEFFSTNVMGAEEEQSPTSTHLTVPGMGGSSSPVPLRKEGYLTKRGKNFGGWKARYFVLDGPELKYYDNQNGPQIGVIKLHKAQIGKQSVQASHDASGKEDEIDNQYRHAFLILEPKRKDSSSLVRHVLCAESDEERDAWVASLLQWVDQKDGNSNQHSTGKDSAKSQDQATTAPKPKRKAPTAPSRSEKVDELAKDTDHNDSDAGELIVQGTSYENTVAGEPPIHGTTVGSFNGSRGVVSPSLNGSFSNVFGNQGNPRNTVSISGPTNGAVIQNSEIWGMKTPVKEKKRSIFGFHRARTPSDTASGQSSASSSVLTADRRAPLLRPVFGMPLAEAVESAPPVGVDVHLPAVVYRCIEYLEAQGAANEEGIFRLSGSQNVIKGLRERFNNEGDVKLLDGNYYDVHAVASLLKLYLRELPSSVLTRELHLDFLKSLEIEDREQKVAAINVLVHMLPRPNMELLSNLCSYLADIANASDVNKMNVRNVAIVFAPTLNIPAPLIQLFLTDYPNIFGDEVGEKSPIKEMHATASAAPQESIRSPRHQMFSDLPTPAYNQNTFSQQGLPGFQPLAASTNPNRNTYAPRQTQQFDGSGFPVPPMYQAGGAGEFSSLNALAVPGGDGATGSSKKNRRESSMMGPNFGLVNQRQASRQTLRDTSSSRIPEAFESFAAQQRAREATPERRFQQQTTMF
ncbi:uncharacterized protein PV09_05548 [Verruconis gallopava]|uniref:RhoGAP-domain-containing protein n=1 Tax=Verruconis gallopava TaxID=253628 RepID=A0A0D2A996_9PEZI|nr:uncharacterized protein PV09_05548 [Verruconis gallopava]KIW03338.1 hypothetical protein PV09_05548 [Verruconis gallopava]